ncbi:MAG TPA: hypothetical protein EYQ12_01340, partial [Oceanospirillaceae bacterium]|nr:hypothetical protein [Oceanospirillaceae bacterium]
MLKLPNAEYAQRRQQLLAQFPAGAVVLIQAAASQIRNGDVVHISNGSGARADDGTKFRVNRNN